MKKLFFTRAMGFKKGFFLLLAFLFALPAFSTWPQGAGKGYFNISFTYLRYHELIDGADLQNGFQHHALQRTVSDHTLNAYFEYGLTERLTLMGDIPYKIMRTGAELHETKAYPYPGDTVQAGRLNAMGNVVLGGRYLLSKGDLLWSAQLMVGMKSAQYQEASGLRSGYDAWYATPRLRLAKGWGGTYLEASFGYRYKTNGYTNDLISDNEFGIRIPRSKDRETWIIIPFGAELPLGQGGYDDGRSVHTGTYRNGEGFVDVGLKVNHELYKGLTLNLATLGALWARHGGNEMTLTAGISYDW
ncbi:MAG: hypothetical protein ABEH38_07880 [Flavobacteriales bacterium]